MVAVNLSRPGVDVRPRRMTIRWGPSGLTPLERCAVRVSNAWTMDIMVARTASKPTSTLSAEVKRDWESV